MVGHIATFGVTFKPILIEYQHQREAKN